MEKDLKIVEFAPLTAGEDLWKAYLEHMDAIGLEVDPEEPPVPHSRRRTTVLAAEKLDYTNKHIYLAMGNGAAAGFAFASVENTKSPSYGANKSIGNMRLSVLPGYRRAGLGRLLLKHLVAELSVKEPAVTELISPVMLDSGRAFIEKLGGTVSLVHGENRLYLKDVDWGMVEAWVAEGARRNPATAVIGVQSIPEADIKNYSEVYTEVINQQPMGDLTLHMQITPEQIRLHERQNRADGMEHDTIYTREADGGISGLTETGYVKETGHRIFQMLTGVRKDCRGRGLGKMLKALMLLDIRRKYPGVKYVSTGNADSNAPMMAINRKLGFKKHMPVHIYKLKIGPALR